MIKVFLSHSSKDAEIAELLIDLIRSALGLKSEEIRCTSVSGYRLLLGANVDQNIRKEIFESTTFIGLLSQSSLHSTYVLFELGARWGAEKHLIPLLMSDIDVTDLKPPLSGLNALQCGEAENLHQLIYELSTSLGVPVSNPAGYEKKIQGIIQILYKPLIITHPSNGDTVSRRPMVQGIARNHKTEVWPIVHPVGSLRYWVQPRALVLKTGKWKSQIYIGREGQADLGSRFEICAVGNPKVSFENGKTLDSWPPAEYVSDILEVFRG